MPVVKKLTTQDIRDLLKAENAPVGKKIYPVLRGGYPLAALLEAHNGCTIVDTPQEAEIIVDDIIASGATMAKYARDFYWIPFWAPLKVENEEVWIVFPWEKSAEADFTELLTRILQHQGKPVNQTTLANLKERISND